MFSFIIVTKKINTRILVSDATGKAFSNPLPGTVVDDVVTLPERYIRISALTLHLDHLNAYGMQCCTNHTFLEANHDFALRITDFTKTLLLALESFVLAVSN